MSPPFPRPGLVEEMAREAGFDLVAFGPAGPGEHGAKLEEWIAAGRHGEMDYLERNLPRLLEPERLLPGARGAVALGYDYGRDGVALESGGRVARYAAGRDYHRALGSRMRRLTTALEREGVRGDSLRSGIDAVPILERALAAQAGIGFLAKSSGIIHAERGPWLLLAEVLTTEAFAPSAPATGSCGTCTACLDTCPTGAIVAPFEVDARRCLSYTTIELRGPIPHDYRAAQGDWLFGCDICIEVCPFHSRTGPPHDDPDARLHPALETWQLVGLLALTPEQWNRDWTGTAMRRAGRAGLQRNAAIVLGNLGQEDAAPVLVKALEDSDAGVRTAAAWALCRLGRGRNEAMRALARETDLDVAADMRRSLAEFG